MSFFNFQPPFTGIVRHIIIINILAFYAVRILMPNRDWIYFALFLPGSESFYPWQMFTHFFMHANFPHLAFNMLTLYFLGPMVEMVWGPRRFLMYYFTCCLGATILHFATIYWELNQSDMSILHYFSPALGSSGGIYGLMAAVFFLFPNLEINLILPPISMRIKYLLPIITLLQLVYGVSGMTSGIAHYAHLGGALAGFLIIGMWTNFRFR